MGTTVQSVVETCLSLTAGRQAAKTLADRKRILLPFVERFGASDYHNIKKFHVLAWVAEHADWKSDWTLKRVFATLVWPFNWCKKQDFIEYNPLHGLSHPAGERGKPIQLCHFRAIMRGTSPAFRRVLIFQQFTGARPCEMSALEWDFINLETGNIVLHIHKTARTRKDRAPRVVAMTPAVVKLLIWIKKRQKPGERFVFLNDRGRPWNRNSLGLRMIRLRERLGIPKSEKLYGVRHWFGTEAILSGVDLKTLAELLGHTTTRMAEHYVHLAGNHQHLHAALGKMFKRR